MATYTRNNAWNNDGTFDNPDLLWYAKGVGVMQSRALDDPNSWWFFAAIHGEYVDPNTPWYTTPPAFPDWGFIPGPPQVPTTPLPSQNLIDLYWDQCQHQSWYFTPWHRGYLLALEAQVREAVVSLGGPSEWALPYWNYFGPNNEYEIPPAFTEKTLPDGTTPNPLYVEARYGPRNNFDIFVPIPPVAETCEGNTIYTGSNAVTPAPGFGGPDTGFSHSGDTSGNLESNPHNLVHVYVGGNAPNNDTWGLMSDPGIAALDPVFYLHHSNIDRMWAAWNDLGNDNPNESSWLNGPAASGEREFVMPMPGGSPWVYTPGDVNSLSQLDYTYDDLTVTVAPQPSSRIARRLTKLGGARAAAKQAPASKGAQGGSMDSADNAELVGAHDGALQIKSSGARATVRLDSNARRKVSRSLARASETSLPDHVYLKLENVRGTRDSFVLNVSVNQQRAGSVALFGLRRATAKDGQHGGSGLTYVLDITNVIDNLFVENGLDTDSLDVRIVPNNAVPDSEEITVGRVSVYRQGQE
ncbi:MAG TPA: tyrosinase family protein [Pyrinomonadaceae bacterium]|nr:tyrosinase family protein [Pyrinomonadaceae bacterium]